MVTIKVWKKVKKLGGSYAITLDLEERKKLGIKEGLTESDELNVTFETIEDKE